MRATSRIIRINELLKREIADLLEKEKFSSSCSLISITEVKTSSDLRHACVFVSVFGNDNTIKKRVLRFLEHNRYNLQKKISKDIILKYTPVLEFKLDDKMEKGDKVLALLAELEREEEEK